MSSFFTQEERTPRLSTGAVVEEADGERNQERLFSFLLSLIPHSFVLLPLSLPPYTLVRHTAGPVAMVIISSPFSQTTEVVMTFSLPPTHPHPIFYPSYSTIIYTYFASRLCIDYAQKG